MLVVASAFVLVRTAQYDEHTTRPRTPAVASRPSVGLRVHEAQGSNVARRRQPHLLAAAIDTATSYARAAFSTASGTPSDTWVRTVLPLCTAAWRAHLESAANGVVVDTVTDRPRVLRVFPSWAPRRDIGATVLLRDPRTGAYDAIYLELVRQGSGFLVGAAQ